MGCALPLWCTVSFGRPLELHGTGPCTEASRCHPTSLIDDIQTWVQGPWLLRHNSKDPWRKSLTGDPDVVQLRWLLSDFRRERVQSELQLLPVQWVLHPHLLWGGENVRRKLNIVPQRIAKHSFYTTTRSIQMFNHFWMQIINQPITWQQLRRQFAELERKRLYVTLKVVNVVAGVRQTAGLSVSQTLCV